MSKCLSACEKWKQSRRGHVPMDIFNAQENANNCCCNCSCNCGCSTAQEASDSQDESETCE